MRSRDIPKPMTYYVSKSQDRNEAIAMIYQNGGYRMNQLADYLMFTIRQLVQATRIDSMDSHYRCSF